MEEVYSFYRGTIELYNKLSKQLGKQIYLLGSIRLALVIAMIAAIWFFKAFHWSVIIGIIIAFMLPFALLMIWHTRLAARKNYDEAIAKLCQDEINGLDYNFSAFDGAAEKCSSEHPFSLDLDIFGEHSLFQSINRTVTWIGKELLAEWFEQPLTDKNIIINRQDAIRELSKLTPLRQHFFVTGILQPGGQNDFRLLKALSKTEPYFIKSKLWKTLVIIVPIIWAAALVGCLLNLIPVSVIGLLFCVSILIAYARSQKVATLYNSVNKMEKLLLTYSDLIKAIEEQSFQSSALIDIHQQLSNHNKVASVAIKQLSHYIGALDQRFSLIGLLLNIFSLRDTRITMHIEQWNETYALETVRWFDALAQFDAYSSLAGFAYNHPDYIYPQISDSYFEMKGKALGHPLLNRNVCVRNDVDIEKAPWFLIITGANMAGKSTYLRTIGVNFLLACIGAPVCAESLTLYPAQMITSLRTADSLSSNESYFFAELKRLKIIIDRLNNGEKLFIILDEILKGTNSIDKQKGSLALIKQLVACKACGIIATHDLVLGSLEKAFPEEVKNYRFEADITGDKLTFTYHLREGVAQNMNACFLMNKMGITLPLS
jgi:hypothetical protein